MEAQPLHLKRELGLGSGITMIIGTMIGSGIFVSPGGVLQRSGSVGASLVVWLVCGVCATLGAMSYIELGTMFPASGADYIYLMQGLGPFVGYLYAWMNTFVLRPVAGAVICQVFALYLLQPFYNHFGSHTFTEDLKWNLEKGVTILALSMMILFSLLVDPVKMASWLQNVLTVAKLIAIALIVAGGTYHIAMGEFEYLEQGFDQVPNTTDSKTQIGPFLAQMLTINPIFRNLNLSILIGIPLVTVIYVLVNIAYLTVLSPSQVLRSDAVVVTWGRLFFKDTSYEFLGEYVPWVASGFVALSTFGAANGTLFGSSRVSFAAAREGHLPEILSYIHSKQRTPIPSLILFTIMAIGLVLTSDTYTMIDFFSFVAWMFYGGSFLSVITLRFTGAKLERPFRIWIVIPILLTFISVFLVLAPIISDPQKEYLYVLAFMASGVLFYVPFVLKKWRIPGMNSFNRKICAVCSLSPGE
ncbi:b(0,+)-type amino acid transporter 1-like [Tigriopus californicus]|uniref:b(0,+)-type amino acid transporter 1-like n=1 Tax=Tigriopus californicus TaxID=6832 RepID=UPI0027DA15B2|nr:b(0,+)-type amino acid transporter 1-like [Tigriopus californicus]